MAKATAAVLRQHDESEDVRAGLGMRDLRRPDRGAGVFEDDGGPVRIAHIKRGAIGRIASRVVGTLEREPDAQTDERPVARHRRAHDQLGVANLRRRRRRRHHHRRSREGHRVLTVRRHPADGAGEPRRGK